MNHRLPLTIAAGGLAIVGVVAVTAWWSAQREFDHVIWTDETQVRNGVRLEMADHLIAHGTLEGRTRSEIVDLLGEPPPTGYFRDWDLVYWLGPERGFISIDSEWLVIRFDENDRVADNKIARD